MKVPNKKELDKHKREEEWASIFLRHLNDGGLDYVIAELYTPSSWGDVDISARSASGTYPSLYIQLCLDTDPKNSGFEKIGEDQKARTFNNFGQTLEAIKGKVEKYEKQKKDYSQITLAIQTYYLIEEDEKYHIPRLRDECKQYKFKAIYLLSPKGQIYGFDKSVEESPELVFKIL